MLPLFVRGKSGHDKRRQEPWEWPDSRVREAVITAKGKEMVRAIDAARERLAAVMFARWSKRDLRELARLLRRFTDDLQSFKMEAGGTD